MTDPRPYPCIVVTESDGPGLALASALRDGGAVVHMLPVVTHEPVSNPAALDAALDRLPEYAWVAFTSVRAVDAVRERPAWKAWTWGGALRPRVAAVGPVTAAALRRHGLPQTLCPELPGALPLAQAMVEAEGGSLSGRAVLWPRSDIARPDLADALRLAGATIVAPVAYCTRPNHPEHATTILAELDAGRIDCVAFLSPSGAANLAALVPGGTLAPLARLTLVASVGPTTSEALAALGAPAGLEAAARTAGDLAAALLSYFGSSERRQT